MTNTDVYELIAARLCTLPEALLCRGFEPPFCATIVGADAAVIVLKFEIVDDVLEPRLVADHSDGKRFALPAHLLVTDVKGRGSCCAIHNPPVTLN